MFCSRCGTEVDHAKQFCPTCGLDLRVTTPVQAIATGDVTELDIIREALREEYELLEELGRGGMAIVYRAREKQLEREVAIKVLPFSLAFDAEFVERFQREARTAAQLEHPNIIPIYRVGRSGRVIYFAMKLLRGSSLSRLLGEKKKLPPAEIRTLLGDVAKALAYAHQRGIVHRDIKPDNIMFDEFGHCVVTDFGIAKAVTGSRLTGTGMSIGTPHYMSPEQARAQTIDGRSDIYSLGVVAYQCLTGEVPYDGEDSFAIGYKHIMEPIPIPLLDTPEERRLFEIVRRMMMKDPLDRFQSADELVRALEGQPATTVAPSPRRITLAQQVAAQQPTSLLPATPRPSQAIPVGEGTPAGGQAGPGPADTPRRPAMRRSSAAPPPPSNSGWFVVALVIVFVAVGAYLAWSKGLLGGRPALDSLPVQPDTAARSDTVPAEDLTRLAPETGTGLPRSRPVSADTTGPAPSSIPGAEPPAPGPAPADSGLLRISGALPRNTRVFINARPVTQHTSVIRLPAGRHEIAISVPNRAMFVDTIEIEPGGTLVLTPELETGPSALRPGVRRLQAVLTCEVPTRANRFGRACYDQGPTPFQSLVPVGPEIRGTPSAAVLLVRVSAQGQTLVVRVFAASSDSLFTARAVEFARGVQWTPAFRHGQPVEGWTQWTFYPKTP
ncbi:MAG TPA: protein kinase [Gemmatimonadales bacterium]|jgi:serine/threonine-protein kinase|nr:protein kinase [Gemmatimonadales bacterium]